MKKLITIFLLCTQAALFAQSKIIFDKVEQDGFRTIGTESALIRTGFTDRHPLKISTVVSLNQDKISYSWHIGIMSVNNFQIPKDALLLIKTNSGTVIESKQMLPSHQTEDIVGTYNTAAKVRTHTPKGIYGLSKEDLLKMKSEGIAKIRIETAGNAIDIAYKQKKSDELSEIISAQLNAIENSISVKKNIRDGF